MMKNVKGQECETRQRNGYSNCKKPEETQSQRKERKDELQRVVTSSGYVFETEEMVRIISQALKNMGYSASAEHLERESGFKEELPQVREIEHAVRNGNWDATVRLVEECVANEEKVVEKCKILVFQEEFFELVESKQTKKALDCLRKKLAPICTAGQVQQFASLFVMNSSQSHQKLGRHSTVEENRGFLAHSLRKLLPKEVVLPPERLVTLLDYSIREQRRHCVYNGTALECSAGRDYVPLTVDLEQLNSQRSRIPTHCVQVICCDTSVQGELSLVCFSPCGTYLLATGKTAVMMYQVQMEERPMLEERWRKKLEGGEITCVAWSKGGKSIAVGKACGEIEMLNKGGENGRVHEPISFSDSPISAVCWRNATEFFASDLDGLICWGCLDGSLLAHFQTHPLYDMCFLPQQELLLVATASDGSRLQTLRVKEKVKHEKRHSLTSHSLQMVPEKEGSFDVRKAVTSLAVSRNGQTVIANLLGENLMEFDSHSGRSCGFYSGLVQKNAVLHASVGGFNDSLVACGSLDARVCIWERGESSLPKSLDSINGGRLPVVTLDGHTQPVNCVAWSPSDPALLISASDDETIRVWYC